MVVSSLTSGGMPSGENLQLYFHEGLRRHNLYPHFQIMDFSISNGNLRCKFCLECSMVGAMTILAYVNSVSPSCVYFITLHRLHQQTCAESEHSNQNQNQKNIWKGTKDKRQTSSPNVIMHHLVKALWGDISKHTVEKSQMNATNVIMHPLR